MWDIFGNRFKTTAEHISINNENKSVHCYQKIRFLIRRISRFGQNLLRKFCHSRNCIRTCWIYQKWSIYHIIYYRSVHFCVFVSYGRTGMYCARIIYRNSRTKKFEIRKWFSKKNSKFANLTRINYRKWRKFHITKVLKEISLQKNWVMMTLNNEFIVSGPLTSSFRSFEFSVLTNFKRFCNSFTCLISSACVF